MSKLWRGSDEAVLYFHDQVSDRLCFLAVLRVAGVFQLDGELHEGGNRACLAHGYHPSSRHSAPSQGRQGPPCESAEGMNE